MLWQFDLDTLLFCPNGHWLSTARAIFSNGRGPVKPVILRRTFQQTSSMMIRSTLREMREKSNSTCYHFWIRNEAHEIFDIFALKSNVEREGDGKKYFPQENDVS